MTENSNIEWTDHTFNPWRGCTQISPACDNCYAAAIAARFKSVVWGGPRKRTSVANWKNPIKWQRMAAQFFAVHGRRQRVFCASMADVFDNQVNPNWRADLWDLILQTPDLDWLLLTKRPQNIEKMKPEFWDEIKGHVWLGTTVESQEVADRNIPHLLHHDSAVRFLSCEPLLGPIDLINLGVDNWLNLLPYNSLAHTYIDDKYRHLGVDWVIVGGESGPNARPMQAEWARSIREQCAVAGVPFLFKQWGEHNQVGGRVGKKHAGRELDGEIPDGFPIVKCSRATDQNRSIRHRSGDGG